MAKKCVYMSDLSLEVKNNDNRETKFFFLNVYDEIIELYTFFEKLCILNTQNCIQSLKNVFIEYRK